jgi:hypothetical protein
MIRWHRPHYAAAQGGIASAPRMIITSARAAGDAQVAESVTQPSLSPKRNKGLDLGLWRGLVDP